METGATKYYGIYTMYANKVWWVTANDGIADHYNRKPTEADIDRFRALLCNDNDCR